MRNRRSLKALLATIAACLLFCSCSHYKMLMEDLRGNPPVLGYVHDGFPPACKTRDTVAVRISGHFMAEDNKVIRNTTTPFIFLVVNHVRTSFVVNFGQSSLNQPYNDFFASSLSDESGRSACFASSTAAADSGYVLSIDMERPLVNARVVKHTTVFVARFFVARGSGTLVHSTETRLGFTARLSKGGVQLFEKHYSARRTQPFINNTRKCRGDYAIDYLKSNMAECLSLSTKQCIDELVKDVNLAVGN